MKYAPLPEADCRVIYTVKTNAVALGRRIQFHTTPNVMPCFIVFRRSSNNTPGLTPTSLGSRDMNDGTWYLYLVSLVGMTLS